MSYYIPLPCCECTASTNPCDLPCFVSGVATISGSINITGSGAGNIIADGSYLLISPAPYTYTINFSLNDSVSLDNSGSGQTDSVVALLNQNFEYAAGTNCYGDDCYGATFINGNFTIDLSCPADVCDGGQQLQVGTALSLAENDLQASICEYTLDGDRDDYVTEYYCNATYPLASTAGVGLNYIACSNNGFSFSFEIGDSVLAFSTIQGDGYNQVGQIFIDDLAPRPLYLGFSGPIGSSEETITGSMNVVVDRVIGYINENNECVTP